MVGAAGIDNLPCHVRQTFCAGIHFLLSDTIRGTKMAFRSLSIIAVTACVFSGCTTKYLARDNLCDRASGGKAVSRAALCMTAAGIEIAQEKPEASPVQTKNDSEEGKGTDQRYKEWIP